MHCGLLGGCLGASFRPRLGGRQRRVAAFVFRILAVSNIGFARSSPFGLRFVFNNFSRVSFASSLLGHGPGKDGDVFACDSVTQLYSHFRANEDAPEDLTLEESDRLRSLNPPSLVEEGRAVSVSVEWGCNFGRAPAIMRP